MKRLGKVFLVGAGPGDPGLLTLRAAELLAEADCVIYDYLVNPVILRRARRKAELIDVGKRGTEVSWTQAEINRLLIDRAGRYKRIVRLKGGDPFVFGRGGEEAIALSEAGIDWEVVPGVSAGASVAAYAGIPITHRGMSSSVTFVAGHEDPSKAASSIRWEHLATGADTLVFFMGVGRIREIVGRLIQHGRKTTTPVAVVRWGTYSDQETWTGELATIADIVEHARVSSPALIVIGEVVKLRQQLQWFHEGELQAADYSLPNPFFEALAS